MRDTLVEVLGEERGGSMYTHEWLVNRVKFHLDSEQCSGEVYVAESEDKIIGHTILRLEDDFGLFSTIYVVPEHRRSNVATVLIEQGEAWFRTHGMKTTRTYTDEHNDPLIKLFEGHGYEVEAIKEEFAIMKKEL